MFPQTVSVTSISRFNRSSVPRRPPIEWERVPDLQSFYFRNTRQGEGSRAKLNFVFLPPWLFKSTASFPIRPHQYGVKLTPAMFLNSSNEWPDLPLGAVREYQQSTSELSIATHRMN